MNWNELFITHWNEKEALRYRVLAYLKQSHELLNSKKLFPIWEDVYKDYKLIKSMQSQALELLGQSPKNLIGMGIDGVPQYQFVDDQAREMLLNIAENLDFTRQLVKELCQKTEILRTEFEASMTLEPVGIISPNVGEGFLLLSNEGDSNLWCWQYRMGIQSNLYAQSQVYTRYLGSFKQNLSTPVNKVKSILAEKVGWNGAYYSSWYGQSSAALPPFSAMRQIAVFKLLQEISGLKHIT